MFFDTAVTWSKCLTLPYAILDVFLHDPKKSTQQQCSWYLKEDQEGFSHNKKNTFYCLPFSYPPLFSPFGSQIPLLEIYLS